MISRRLRRAAALLTLPGLLLATPIAVLVSAGSAVAAEPTAVVDCESLHEDYEAAQGALLELQESRAAAARDVQDAKSVRDASRTTAQKEVVDEARGELRAARTELRSARSALKRANRAYARAQAAYANAPSSPNRRTLDAARVERQDARRDRTRARRARDTARRVRDRELATYRATVTPANKQRVVEARAARDEADAAVVAGESAAADAEAAWQECRDARSAPFVGVWSGSVEQVGFGEYSARISLSVVDGELSGVVEYPSLQCGGTLGEAVFEGDTVRLRERITYGVTSCVAESDVRLTPEAGGLRYDWSYYSSSATGLLARASS